MNNDLNKIEIKEDEIISVILPRIGNKQSIMKLPNSESSPKKIHRKIASFVEEIPVCKASDTSLNRSHTRNNSLHDNRIFNRKYTSINPTRKLTSVVVNHRKLTSHTLNKNTLNDISFGNIDSVNHITQARLKRIEIIHEKKKYE